MRLRFAAAIAVGLGLWALPVGTATGQQLDTVTVAALQPGQVVNECPPQPSGLSVTPPEYVLIRSGDLTDGLTVAIAWSGDLTGTTTVSPTSVEFAPGSSAAPVTPGFAPVPDTSGELTLTITAAAGYQLGEPSAATTTVTRVSALCVRQPDAPPPVVTNPTFTG